MPETNRTGFKARTDTDASRHQKTPVCSSNPASRADSNPEDREDAHRSKTAAAQSPRVMTDGGFRSRPVAIKRDGKRVASGALLPSGTIVVEWNREAFPEGERTDHNTRSIYASIDDAEQASGGEVIVNPDVDDGPEVRD